MMSGLIKSQLIDMFQFLTPIPLSLYIHLPWCVKKCPYCDFNSHEVKNEIPEAAYIAALLRDLDHQLPAIWGRRLVSIFFGGGTPSLFSPAGIEQILQGVHTRLNYGPDIEITMEANPGTIDEARFVGFRQAGINRLSIGIQSLQDDKLKILGRIHHQEQALRAIEAATKANFTNFNLDFMHGLPGQSLDDAMHDLHTALQFHPPHLSWYQLTIEPNTLFYHQQPTLPEENILHDIQDAGKKILATASLQQYEVSAYAKENFECAHNKNYWEFGDYLGIGAGAHSKITDIAQRKIIRHAQVKHPKDYLSLNTPQTASQQIVSEKDCIFEFMLNALRLTHGVKTSLFTERTGLDFSVIQPIVEEAKQKKLLINSTGSLCPTELGQAFLNDLIQLFLPK